MKNTPYSLATDGSNDNGLKKMNPLIVQIYDVNLKRVKTSFLDMCLSSGSTAQMLLQGIDECLAGHRIPWENCVAFSVDNANVNLAKNKSILMRVKLQSPSVYFNGCQCHVVHNTFSAAAKAFNAETGFDVEDLLVDIYYWFDYSTKRKCKLVEYTHFCTQEYGRIIKQVNTRWLSLEKVITRTLLQYQSLKTYFLSEDESAARFKRLQTAFSNPMTEVYLLFLQSTLQIFVNLNLFLQREEPIIGAMNSSLTRFLKLLACKFISPGIVKASSSFQQLLDVEQYLPGMLRLFFLFLIPFDTLRDLCAD